MKTLEDMRAALESQDEALANAKQQLAAMGDVQFQISPELLEQLDEACTVRGSNDNVQLGAVRA
jgi:hypothetical protein